MKIREQLEDKSHPIIWIIKQFQVAFTHDINEKLAEIQRMNDSLTIPDHLNYSGPMVTTNMVYD